MYIVDLNAQQRQRQQQQQQQQRQQQQQQQQHERLVLGRDAERRRHGLVDLDLDLGLGRLHGVGRGGRRACARLAELLLDRLGVQVLQLHGLHRRYVQHRVRVQEREAA